jgi:hypothetical protein
MGPPLGKAGVKRRWGFEMVGCWAQTLMWKPEDCSREPWTSEGLFPLGAATKHTCF